MALWALFACFVAFGASTAKADMIPSSTSATPQLGVCYYPWHWPRTNWEQDAAQMAAAGIHYVRLGEFAWALFEPDDGIYDWSMLDEILDILDRQGLQAVVGTPTATPPKWLVDKIGKSMLPVGADGNYRNFGSRRHYSFSSPEYLAAAEGIVTAMATRYGKHPAVAGWQIDNELACHDTARTFDINAEEGFRSWLAERYGTVEALNQAWGNIFWSEGYLSFDTIELPNLTVTTANPAAWLDFYRYSSSKLVGFAAAQADIIRSHSPGRFVTTQGMAWTFDFDNFDLFKGLDFASWDNYPLGFADTSNLFSDDEKVQYARTGAPDLSAFHHDLYLASGARKPFWVMEQQPGPVNWADHNPSPAAGMIRLWSWEAIAHGAQVVSYFRWKQAKFAQEQMHSGLNLPDGSPDVGLEEAQQVYQELQAIGDKLGERTRARVGLIMAYDAQWILSLMPNGAEYDYVTQVYSCYSAARSLGLDVDILRPGEDSLEGYEVLVVPSLPHVPPALVEQLEQYDGHLILGARTGSKTSTFHIPDNLPPGPLGDLVGLKVRRVESLRPQMTEAVQLRSGTYNFSVWKEWVEATSSDMEVFAVFDDGKPAIAGIGKRQYVAFYPSTDVWREIIRERCEDAGVHVKDMPGDLRLTRRGNVTFAINYGSEAVQTPLEGNFLLGSDVVDAHSLSIVIENHHRT